MANTPGIINDHPNVGGQPGKAAWPVRLVYTQTTHQDERMTLAMYLNVNADSGNERVRYKKRI